MLKLSEEGSDIYLCDEKNSSHLDSFHSGKTEFGKL